MGDIVERLMDRQIANNSREGREISHVGLEAEAAGFIRDLRAQLTQARSDALEEAAELCDREHLRRKEQYKGRGLDDIQKERWRVAAQLSGLIADEIRALKETTQEPTP